MRFVAVLIAALLLTSDAATGQRPSGALTPQIESILRSIKAADKGQLAVSEEDGRFLRVLVATRGAKSILEIGAASGYSGIWLGLGARESGGRVVAIEYDAARAMEAAANIRRAGLDDVVRVVHGDAFKEIPKLTGTFDFVFLDAWKPDYKKFFDMVFPRLTPGGVFTAHNVVNKKKDMEPFLRTVQGHSSLFTTIVSPSGEGMSVSYRIK
ncbi:MAG TPA: class I SAM-dependent methyltransferase [Vicinamibacterales bacterium]|nr:class I SAM-dependent methyltransferase [Vicinamibacterales bacterium]